MKIVITGHASGIGKSLLEIFNENCHECIGYDILTGDDLECDMSVQKVIESCKTADVFINNAFANQARLLHEVHNLWFGKNKVIINISSFITWCPKQNIPKEMHEYYENKQNLDIMCRNFSQYRNPYVMNVRPSWVNTEFKFNNISVANINDIKIEPQNLASLIYFHVVNKEKYQVIDVVVK